MKRVFAIILLPIYLLTAGGLYFGMHYCGGKFSSFSFIPYSKSCGCSEKSENTKPCCKDKSFSCKVDNGHQSTKTNNPTGKITGVKYPLQNIINNTLSSSSDISSLSNPPPNNTPVYIAIRVLRI